MFGREEKKIDFYAIFIHYLNVLTLRFDFTRALLLILCVSDADADAE